jgi:hypothetical protein
MPERLTWYAQTSALRGRQIAVDAAVALWVLLWLLLARAAHRAVSLLGAPGRELEEAGDGLAGGLSGAAERAGAVPGVGGGLRAPLDAAAGAGGLLSRAGAAQQDAVGTLALLLALLVGGLPIAWAMARWLPARLTWAREATAAGRLRADVDLLALRAAASASLVELSRLGPDPVTRWRAGDSGAGRELADLELRRLGLRPETPAP